MRCFAGSCPLFAPVVTSPCPAPQPGAAPVAGRTLHRSSRQAGLTRAARPNPGPQYTRKSASPCPVTRGGCHDRFSSAGRPGPGHGVRHGNRGICIASVIRTHPLALGGIRLGQFDCHAREFFRKVITLRRGCSLEAPANGGNMSTSLPRQSFGTARAADQERAVTGIASPCVPSWTASAPIRYRRRVPVGEAENHLSPTS